MQEIKFRGLRLDNGEWVYGDICQAENDMGVITKAYIAYDADFTCGKAYGSIYLMTDRYFEVDPKTIGQDTGLKDKNGKKIFDGDKLLVEGSKGVYIVSYNKKECVYEIKSRYDILNLGNPLNELKVIGTIHDKEEKDEE